MSQPPPASRTPPPGPKATPSAMAVGALVLGLMGMCVPLVGIIALLVGITAIDEIDNPANRRTGRGIARIGIILGGIGTCLSLAILILGFLPHGHTTHHTLVRSNAQLRLLHQDMYIYGQGNGGYYPGLDELGEPSDLTVAGRLFLLLDGNYFSPEGLISPVDADKQPWTSGEFNEQHYSYAMLSIAEAGGRRREWVEHSVNPEAIVLSDRNTGTAAAPMSLYSDMPGEWRGGAVWNDNHVETLTQPFADTNYAGTQNLNDELFIAAGADDALLIHTGE